MNKVSIILLEKGTLFHPILLYFTFYIMISCAEQNVKTIYFNIFRHLRSLGGWAGNTNGGMWCFYIGVHTDYLVITIMLILLCVLISGTEEERGILKWRAEIPSEVDTEKTDTNIYDLPYIQKHLDKLRWVDFLPFCPSFNQKLFCRFRCCKRANSDERNKVLDVANAHTEPEDSSHRTLDAVTSI